MSNPQFKPLTGVVNGTNAIFTTPGATAYTPGTTAVYLNGQLLFDRNAVGGQLWTESDPSMGEITIDLTHVPQVRTSDGGLEEVAMFWLDTLGAPTIEVEELRGRIQDVDRLTGRIDDVSEIVGTIADVDQLGGRIQDVDQVQGSIRDFDRLSGILEDC
jgi:hypothetical protein